jgi:hypothetical protein
MRRHLSYANVAATLALVFAMSGGALAANHYLINSANQISPKVLKKLKGGTGKTGASGAAGATGATGAQGPGGKEGTPGKEGLKGEKGEPGPLVNTLPSGKTIRGDYYIDNEAAKAGEFASDSLSFVFPLSAAPTAHVILKGETPPAECPGTAADPQAQPGNLCVYEGDDTNRASVDVRDETTGVDGKTNPYGVGVWEKSTAIGESISGGTWAVTAP